MKIAGVVNDYKEALDIEDIVKAFIIKQRIFNILSLEKKKNFDSDEDTNIIIKPVNYDQYAESSNKKIILIKNNEENSPVFNVRGLI